MKGEHLQSGLCRTPFRIFSDEGCPAFFHELLDQDSAHSMQEICCIPRVFNKTAWKSLQRCPCLDSRNRELLRLKFPAPRAIIGFWIFSEDSYVESSVPGYHYWNTLEVWACRAFWKMLRPLGHVLERHCHSLVTSSLHPGMRVLVLMPLHRCEPTRSVSQRPSHCERSIPFLSVSWLSQTFATVMESWAQPPRD